MLVRERAPVLHLSNEAVPQTDEEGVVRRRSSTWRAEIRSEEGGRDGVHHTVQPRFILTFSATC